MIETTYRDLAEFGLLLITPAEPAFSLWFEEIRNIPEPFRPDIERLPDRAAILENQSESAVITLRYVWRYTTMNGVTRTTSCLNLGSSRQMDVLTGRETAERDSSSFILPGSRRLITEEGMFGDNRDVLGQQLAAGGGGWGFSGRRRGGARGMSPRDPDQDVVRVELALDVAIFADGLCVGPDESGLRQSLIEQIERQKEIADQIVRELRDGAPQGRIFEMLRPLARHRPPVASAQPGEIDDRQATGRRPEGYHHAPLLSMFARSALNQLINADDTTLPTWFEAAAAISPVRLRRPQ
ncbi:MAG TPA: hypothetical protein VK752_08240 [Bryobacteraceae bacterium]|jgi:hypothetical protein|nr:hypothetical protein [Bryobacteraceae bacterium]